MSDNLPKLSVFDVDHTLIKGDSFWPYLATLRGWPQTLWALIMGLIAYMQHKPSLEFRTFIKDQLMTRLLSGTTLPEAQDAAERLRIWRKWDETMRRTLMEHFHSGHHIVIASGGLSIYLPEILKDISYNALICTEVGQENGKLTGKMTNGNCVRERKAELLAAYIEKNGPFGESWGFGNYPHDIPMLNLVKHRILV